MSTTISLIRTRSNACASNVSGVLPTLVTEETLMPKREGKITRRYSASGSNSGISSTNNNNNNNTSSTSQSSTATSLSSSNVGTAHNVNTNNGNGSNGNGYGSTNSSNGYGPRRYLSYPQKAPFSLGELSFSSILTAVTIMMGMFYLGGHLRYETMMTELEKADLARQQMYASQEKLLLELEKARRVNRADTELLEQVDSLRKEARARDIDIDLAEEANSQAHKEAELATKRYETYVEQTEKEFQELFSNIQQLSKALAIEYFGPGPHYVQFEVRVWENRKPIKAYFTVELFPIDKLPASVHTFLQQVHRGLWDNTSFYLNGKHVLMARPVSGNGLVSKRKDFVKAGVEHVIFSEYHEDYPHEPYTLGFTGTPPGPSFYINKQDNTIPHGPGGRQHRKGEPCFAKIIIGKETIDRIGHLKGTDKDPAHIQPVDIINVRILKDLSEAVGGSDYLKELANDDEK